ncbi:hypothetical protein V5J35_001720 [Endozoicomonas sp. NE40]|uniref:Uncharacterized protein n=2 Tax=Endozoicomonas lisbonensis TaxID=3120522 RepID=A0ABV2SFI9_9GAMM
MSPGPGLYSSNLKGWNVNADHSLTSADGIVWPVCMNPDGYLISDAFQLEDHGSLAFY